MNKKTIFYLITVLLPILLILLIELSLRLLGFGERYELFHKIVSQDGIEYYVMNAGISRKYFRNTGFQSDNQSDLFLKTKTDSTFRVFVQGASTSVGFPFYRNGSFPRLLKHRLSLTFPTRNIEVINTGITAVNSYTIWDLTEQIIEKEPDLVIIYAGHNEYYGALGAGSTISAGHHPALIRTYLKLKNLRFFQLLERAYVEILESNRKTGYRIGETTLMEVMAREQQIPYSTEVFNAGINQFKSNLKKTLSKYQDHNIPVIISTLVSNEKDVSPFISDDYDESHFQKKLEANDMVSSAALAEKSAKASFKLAQLYLGRNQDSSKKYFQKAKDLDLLRFRAPEEINDLILEFSKNDNVHLVDSKKLFETKSQFGIIGNELLTEHVHPNVKGNFIIADGLYNKIKDLKLAGKWENYISYDEAFQDIPITHIDSIRGKMIVEDLKRSWPYVLNMSGKNPLRNYHTLENPSYEERKAIALYSGSERWDDVMREAYHRYKNIGDYEKALRVAQSLISEFPEQHKVYDMAGNICREMKRTECAKFYFDKRDRLK